MPGPARCSSSLRPRDRASAPGGADLPDPIRPWLDDADDPNEPPADEAAHAGSGPALLRALGVALRGYGEGFALFSVLNVAVVLAALAVAAAFTALAAAAALAPLIALPGAVLMRAAVAAARGESLAWSSIPSELARRPWRKLAIATVQLVVTAVGLLNLSMAAAAGGVAGIAIAGVGAYGLIVAWAYAIALWPIVADPRRDEPLVAQLRLALLVLVSHPIGILVLFATAVAGATACALLIVPLILVPPVVMLLCAAYVVPAADALVPLGAD